MNPDGRKWVERMFEVRRDYASPARPDARGILSLLWGQELIVGEIAASAAYTAAAKDPTRCGRDRRCSGVTPCAAWS